MELRQYGVATTLYFPLIDKGFTDFESTPVTIASGDCKISKDGGAFANTTTASFSHVAGGIYSIPLTATEMQAKQIVVKIVDQTGTKEWEDQCIIITTNNHASAEIPTHDPTAAPTAAAVWGALVATYQTNSTFGKAWADATTPKLAAVVSGIIGADVWNSLVATYQTNSTFGKAWSNATTPILAGGVALTTAGVQAVWDALTSALTTAGSIGKLLVDNVNASITAIKAKTDNLPSDPADASDIAGAFSTVNSTLSTIAGYIDTEVAAIKAKTDLIPASPAAVSDIPTAVSVASAVLKRNASSDEATAPPTSLIGVILKLTSKFNATTGVTYRTDGSTVFMTQSIVTDPAADPITQVGVGG